MAIQTEPTRIAIPFAESGTKNAIPDTQPTPSASQAASWEDGFPAQCSLPLSAGGIPPARADFNGIFNAITQSERFTEEGGVWEWDATVDYAANRIVLGSDGLLYWSIAQSGPNVGGAQDPTTDTVHTYWVSPKVPTMPIGDNSKALASTQWVKSWYSNLFLPTDVYVNASSGDDSNDGLTAATAKKTIAAARAIYSSPGKIKPSFATFHIAAGAYSEALIGISNVSVRYDCGYVTTVNGVYLDGADKIVYLTGRIATTERFLVFNGATLFLGYGSADCNINFDGIQNNGMLVASSKGSIRAEGEGLVQMNFINGCVASTATVVCDLYGLVSFNHGTSNVKATLTGSVTGNKYCLTNNSAVYGTGSTTYIIGSGNSNTQDSTSSYS